MIKTKSSAPSGPSDGVEWEPAPTRLTRRCVFMEIYGDTGTGRTTLALSAPGPIALMHASEKIEGIVQPRARETEIRMMDFGIVNKGTPDRLKDKAGKLVDAFKAAWYDAMRSWAKSIVLDTHTEAWEVLRLARFGLLTPRGVVKSLYGPVNAEWRSLFKAFREQSNCNVVAIGQTKEEYKNDKATGRRIRAGQKDIDFMADVIVHTYRRKDGTFVARVEKGWWNAHAEGVELEDESISFPMLMAVITETDPEEWS